jgi:hypothetical protein
MPGYNDPDGGGVPVPLSTPGLLLPPGDSPPPATQPAMWSTTSGVYVASPYNAVIFCEASTSSPSFYHQPSTGETALAGTAPSVIAGNTLISVATQSAAYSATPGQLVPVSTAGGAVTVTLTGPYAGARIGVRKTSTADTNILTVAVPSGIQLNGVTTGTYTLDEPLDCEFVSLDGTNWWTTKHCPQAWVPLSLINSWVDYGGGFLAPAVRQEPGRILRFRGACKSGASNTIVAANLPLLPVSGTYAGGAAVVDSGGFCFPFVGQAGLYVLQETGTVASGVFFDGLSIFIPLTSTG